MLKTTYLKRILPLVLILFTLFVAAQEEIKHQVYFNTDEFEVPLTEENRLLLFISNLEDVRVNKIEIYGFCDDRGTDAYNQDLSQYRADKIKDLFSGYGIDENLITNVNGKGEILLRIVKERDLSKIRGLNRKVEIVVRTEPKKATDLEEEALSISADGKRTLDDIEKGTIKKGDKITLNNINFKTGYSYITKESRKTLENISAILLRNPHVYFTIEGHVCCTQGSRDAVDKKTRKRNLSVARARFIFDYLESRGVHRNRMKYVGMRRRQPLGGEPEFDRRVEILITYIGKKK
ncbi:OmpA family protein [Aurantibacter sp.]|uniref:OmpA family protein n=1 Tax=Aurantibacter sp. TaxID=2807103 RepID=UPI0035C82E35